MSMEKDQEYSREEIESLLQLRWELDNLRSNAYSAIVILVTASSISPVIAFSKKLSPIIFLLQILMILAITSSWLLWGKFSGHAQNLYTMHFNKSKGPDPFQFAPIIEVIFQDKVRYASLFGAICHVGIPWLINIFAR